MSSEPRLPTALFVEGHLRRLNSEGKSYYIHQRGDPQSGVILLKINGLGRGFRLLIQQRDLEGKLGWVDALGAENPAESSIDSYISRAITHDPDLWAIEAEDKNMSNIFNQKT